MFSREFLKGKELSDEVIESIMTEYGKSIGEKDKKIDTLSTEKDGLDSQLKELNEKVKELSKVDATKLNDEIKSLNEKYDKDTKELQDKIAKQEYGYKVKEATSGLKFTSESAKKAFIEELNTKTLAIKEDKLDGFDDFVNNYKTTDPKAFQEEKPSDQKQNVDLGGNHTDPVDAKDAYARKVMGLK